MPFAVDASGYSTLIIAVFDSLKNFSFELLTSSAPANYHVPESYPVAMPALAVEQRRTVTAALYMGCYETA